MNPREASELVNGLAKAYQDSTFKIVGFMGRIFGSLAARDEETYWHTIRSGDGNGFVDLGAVVGEQDTGTVEITQEADFVATRFLATNLNPATGVPITGSWRVTVRDGSSDRELMRDAIHLDNIAGTSQRSVPFTKNRLFRRNSTITFTFTQLQAIATRVFFTIQGYKIFDEAALDLVRRR